METVGATIMTADKRSGADSLVYDLYCGHGGVGLTLDELDVRHIGVDIVDHADTYPGEFVHADASQPPLTGGADLVWASPPCTAYSALSPTAYGSREAAIRECPTIPELRVKEIARNLGAEYVIENVPGASREGHIENPTRVNGLAFGLPFDLERHFETSFSAPHAVEKGDPDLTMSTRDNYNNTEYQRRELAEAKSVPTDWPEQSVHSAIPPEYVQYLLHYCPAADGVSLPDSLRQRPLSDQFVTVADGGNDRTDSTATAQEGDDA